MSDETVSFIMPVNVECELGPGGKVIMTWEGARRDVPGSIYNMMQEVRSSEFEAEELNEVYSRFLETGNKSVLQEHPALATAMKLAEKERLSLTEIAGAIQVGKAAHAILIWCALLLGVEDPTVVATERARYFLQEIKEYLDL